MVLKKVGPNMVRTVTWVGALVIEAWFLVTLCGASEYLPGRPDDIKVFEDTRFGNTCTMEVDRKLGNWRHYNTFGGFGPLWIWTSPESECIYVWSDVVDSCQMITDFSKAQGYTSRIDLDPCNRGQSVLAGREETVLTPAGKFEGSVRVDFQTSCADAGLTSMWFAPDVGVIQWSSLNIAGPVDHVLLSGTINGEAYPRSLSVSATFSDTSVYLNMMPPVDPLSVQEVQASIEVKNGTEHEISFHFVNGQRFEISIFIPLARPVRRFGHRLAHGPTMLAARPAIKPRSCHVATGTSPSNLPRPRALPLTAMRPWRAATAMKGPLTAASWHPSGSDRTRGRRRGLR